MSNVSDEFVAHLSSILASAKMHKMTIKQLSPSDLANTQIDSLRVIVRARNIVSAAVIEINGYTTFVHYDPRHPTRMCYIGWDGNKWVKPEGRHLSLIKQIDRLMN